MSVPHDHQTYVDGCYRCELSRDDAAVYEITEAMRPLVARLAEETPSVRMLDLGHGYQLVKEDYRDSLTKSRIRLSDLEAAVSDLEAAVSDLEATAGMGPD